MEHLDGYEEIVAMTDEESEEAERREARPPADTNPDGTPARAVTTTIATIAVTLDEQDRIYDGHTLAGRLRDVTPGEWPGKRFTYACGLEDDPDYSCGESPISYPTAREAMLAAALHARGARHQKTADQF